MNYIPSKMSNYYTEDMFNRIIYNSNANDAFSLIYCNIRSLPAHWVELESYLDVVCVNFTIIGLSEPWLSDWNFDLYSLSGYQYVGYHRSDKADGRVSLFIRSDIHV